MSNLENELIIKIGTFTATIRLEPGAPISRRYVMLSRYVLLEDKENFIRSCKNHLGFEPDDIEFEEVLMLACEELHSRARTNGSANKFLHHAEISLVPVQVGDTYSERINQAMRDCEVLLVKRTRYRISFQMPTCVQEGWRHGIVRNGKLYRLVIKRAGLAWKSGKKVRPVTCENPLLSADKVYTVESYDRGAVSLQEIQGELFLATNFESA